MKIRIGSALVLVMLAAAGICFVLLRPVVPPPLLAQAVKKDFFLDLHITGKLQTQSATILTCPLQGGGQVVKLKPEGSMVKQGDIILEFDDTQLQQEAQKASLELKTREAERAEALAKMQAEKEKLQLAREKFKRDAAVADLQLQDLKGQPRQNDLQIARMEFDYAKIIMDMAQKEYTRLSRDIAPELMVQSEIRKLEMSLTKAISNYRKADYNFNLVSLGALPLKMEKCEKEKERAILERQQIEKTIPDTNKQLKSNLIQCEARIETAKMRLEKTQKELAKSKLSAPCDGLLLYRQVWGSKVSVGGRYWLGAPLLEIPDLQKMEVCGEVLESQIESVQTGQVVEVRIDGIPDATFSGSVRQIGKVAVDSSEQEISGFGVKAESTGIKVFEVLIELRQASPMFLPKMTARAKIRVAEARNAIVIPKVAVQEDRGLCLVDVYKDGKRISRQVKTGIADNHEIVIVEGLQAGEWVSLQAVQTK